MASFLELVKKGYYRQAETALKLLPSDTKAFQFNLGLLHLLQNQPKKAYELLKHNQSDSLNCQVAMTMLNMNQSQRATREFVLNNPFV